MGKIKSIVVKDTSKCVFCQRPADDPHHVFGGSRHNASDKWKLIVPLCRECHEKVHHNRDMDLKCKVAAQIAFIKRYGQKKFMEEFGKNFLEQEIIDEYSNPHGSLN